MYLVKIILLCAVPVLYGHELHNHVGQQQIRNKRNSEQGRIDELNSINKDKLKLRLRLLPKPKEKLNVPRRIPQKIITQPNNNPVIRQNDAVQTIAAAQNNRLKNNLPANSFIRIPVKINKIAIHPAEKETNAVVNGTSPFYEDSDDIKTTEKQKPITHIVSSESVIKSPLAEKEYKNFTTDDNQMNTTSFENKIFSNLEKCIMEKLPVIIESVLGSKIKNVSNVETDTKLILKDSNDNFIPTARNYTEINKSNKPRGVDLPKKDIKNSNVKEQHELFKKLTQNNTKLEPSGKGKPEINEAKKRGDSNLSSVNEEDSMPGFSKDFDPSKQVSMNKQDEDLNKLLLQPIVKNEMEYNDQSSPKTNRFVQDSIKNENFDEISIKQQNYTEIIEGRHENLKDSAAANPTMLERTMQSYGRQEVVYDPYPDSYSYDSPYLRPNVEYTYRNQYNNNRNAFKIWEEKPIRGQNVDDTDLSDKNYRRWSNTEVIIKTTRDKPLKIQITPYQQLLYRYGLYDNYYNYNVKPVYSSYPGRVYKNFGYDVAGNYYQ